MREIDFLPEWYKTGKKRRGSYRRQYIVIIGLFVTMIAWSLAAGYTISAVEGHVEIMQKSLDAHQNIEAKFDQYNQAFSLLQERGEKLDRLTPTVEIASVFAEISYIASDNIMLTEFEIRSEIYEGASGKANAKSRSRGQKNMAMPDPNTRYKIHVTGIAANAAAVTDFMAQMEKSPYFCLVIPGLLQDMKDSVAMQFQISCYVDNYVME
jgi:hypothetical protein